MATRQAQRKIFDNDVTKRHLSRCCERDTYKGWTVTHDPYIFRTDLRTDPRLIADLGAERLIAAERKYEKIVVEIKNFLRTSQVVDLEEAVGKYSIYNIFLRQHEPDRTLWLAVPLHASENILSREVGRVTLEAMRIPVIVYSLSGKEPLIWKIPKSFTENV
ncbi:element excision factor XisH family protein [Desulfococcaceae bacterium HSG8]|nr:element excision factor XisH family protein [Desulfococcaceae bacterium HSG8]